MSTGATQEQVSYLIKQLQQQVRAHLDRALVRHDVTMATYAALAVLDEDPGLSNAGLARACFVTPQTMNRMVQDLEAAGCVTRRADPQHGRARQARLTATGCRLVEACRGEVDALHDRMLTDLEPDEVRLFHDLLRRCLDALHD